MEIQAKEMGLVFPQSKNGPFFPPAREGLFYFVLIRGIDLSNQWLRKGLLATGPAMAQVLDALSTVMAWSLDRVGVQEQGSH